jgi:hypothetical protein
MCPVLIGQLPLESLDFVVDPIGRRLIGNPDHGGEHMMDLLEAIVRPGTPAPATTSRFASARYTTNPILSTPSQLSSEASKAQFEDWASVVPLVIGTRALVTTR